MKADNENLHLYNSALQPFVSSLRKEMTKAEACLWKYVLKAKAKGILFQKAKAGNELHRGFYVHETDVDY